MDETATNTMIAPFGPGGSGGRCNLILAAKAVRDRWPMSPEMRDRIIKWLMSVGEDSEDHRARVQAAKVLVEADKINMEQEKRDLGIRDLIDITSAGKPITITEAKSLPNDELERRIAELESRAGTTPSDSVP